MFRFLPNGVLVCGAIFALQLLVCIPCAYALAKLRFHGRDTLFSAVLVGLRPSPGAVAIDRMRLVNVDAASGDCFPRLPVLRVALRSYARVERIAHEIKRPRCAQTSRSSGDPRGSQSTTVNKPSPRCN
jgi:hypothetical protein